MAKVLELQLQQQSFQWIFYNPINGRKKKTPWVASWGNFQRGNRFEDLWRGYDFILLESSKLACHIASWVSQRTPWFTDKGQFITAMELARLSSICVLIPKLKFSKVIWRGPGATGLHGRNWAQGTGTLYTNSLHACSLLWRETPCLSSKVVCCTHIVERRMPHKGLHSQDVQKYKRTMENYLPITEFNLSIAKW